MLTIGTLYQKKGDSSPANWGFSVWVGIKGYREVRHCFRVSNMRYSYIAFDKFQTFPYLKAFAETEPLYIEHFKCIICQLTGLNIRGNVTIILK